MRYYNLLLVLICSFLASCVKDDAPDNAEERINPGDKLPEFSVIMDDGTLVSNKSMAGKTSVIVFFHTLCGDCRHELPVVQKVYDSYAADEDVMIVAVSREEDAESVSRYWDENGFTVPFSAQEDRYVYELFSTRGVPRIYIADVDGTVHYVHSDVDMPSYKQLVEEIENVKQ